MQIHYQNVQLLLLCALSPLNWVDVLKLYPKSYMLFISALNCTISMNTAINSFMGTNSTHLCYIYIYALNCTIIMNTESMPLEKPCFTQQQKHMACVDVVIHATRYQISGSTIIFPYQVLNSK